MVSASSSKPPSKVSRSESLSVETIPGNVSSQSPSTAFAASLVAGNKVSCVRLLKENFDSVTLPGSAFEWLKDTKILGLTPDEIVSLLIEGSNQIPWICYDLVSDAAYETDLGFYRADYTQPVHPERLGHSTVAISNIEVKRKISELCGLGGIIPTPNDRAIWDRELDIDVSSRSVRIVYHPTSERIDGNKPQLMKVFVDQCLYALDRLIKLLQWLQSYGLVSDHFMIFRVKHAFEVEGVRVPIAKIKDLEECAKRTADQLAEADKSILESHGDQLSTAATAILRLTAWSYPPRESFVGAIADCAVAVQALCTTMLSLARSHIGEIDPFFLENSLSLICLRGVWLPENRRFLHYRLVNLTCAGDMVDSQIMAFIDRVPDANEQFDLAITPEDLLNLWGPGDLVASRSSDREEILPAKWLHGIAIRSGIIYRPSANSSKMHWKAGTAEVALTQIEFLMVPEKQMIIGGLDLVNETCPVRPGRDNTISRANIDTVIEELGTWPEKWNIREKQGGFQGGQFVNAGFNATWIKSDSRTRKQKGLEQMDLDFLNKPWGLLVSLCTGVAQRVALREVVAEVILPMMDAWMGKTVEWQTLISTGDGLLMELKKPTFRAWVSTLKNNEQHALDRIVGHVLQKICWTGINDSAKLVVSCPTFDDSDGCVHIPMKDRRAFACILKDTERSATFACLTNMCFEVHPPICQGLPAPRWQNQIHTIVTSVCQYQWLGADDWIKVHQNDLKHDVFYWMGTSEDRRKVTVRTLRRPMGISGVPCVETRLSVSNSPSYWRFFRRAWERFEKVRQDCHIELRERSLMTESYATEVTVQCRQ